MPRSRLSIRCCRDRCCWSRFSCCSNKLNITSPIRCRWRRFRSRLEDIRGVWGQTYLNTSRIPSRNNLCYRDRCCLITFFNYSMDTNCTSSKSPSRLRTNTGMLRRYLYIIWDLNLPEHTAAPESYYPALQGHVLPDKVLWFDDKQEVQVVDDPEHVVQV